MIFILLQKSSCYFFPQFLIAVPNQSFILILFFQIRNVFNLRTMEVFAVSMDDVPLLSPRKFSTAALSEKPILCKRCGRFRIVFILMLLRRGRNIKNPQQHLFCQEKLSAIEPPSNESNVIKCVLAVVFCSAGWLDRRCWLEPRRAAWERLMNESWLLRCLTYFHLFHFL